METLLKCRKFDVVRHPVPGTDGAMRNLEYIVHPGAVVILPLLDERRCLLLRQFRHTLQQELWELPAGTLDRPGEDPQAAAARELEEEAGYRAGRWDFLCEFYPSPGILTELIRSFVARDMTKTRQQLEPMERIQVECIEVEHALSMIRDGQIRDAKTIVTFAQWDMMRRGRP